MIDEEALKRAIMERSYAYGTAERPYDYLRSAGRDVLSENISQCMVEGPKSYEKLCMLVALAVSMMEFGPDFEEDMKLFEQFRMAK